MTNTIRERTHTIEKLTKELDLNEVTPLDELPEDFDDQPLYFSKNNTLENSLNVHRTHFDDRSDQSVQNNNKVEISYSDRSDSLKNLEFQEPDRISTVKLRPSHLNSVTNQEIKKKMFSNETHKEIKEQRLGCEQLSKGRGHFPPEAQPIGFVPTRKSFQKPSPSPFLTGDSLPVIIDTSIPETASFLICMNSNLELNCQPNNQIKVGQKPDQVFSRASLFKERRFSAKLERDSLSNFALNSFSETLKKRVEQINENNEKDQINEGLLVQLNAQIAKLSVDLNSKTEEIFAVKKLLREIENDLFSSKENLRLKNIKINQLEFSVLEFEKTNSAELKRLKAVLDETTHNLVNYKIMHSELLSNLDIHRARFTKQIKVKNFELSILRNEIEKFNNNEKFD